MDAEDSMKLLIRLEELGLFVLSIHLFSMLPVHWWLFPVLLLAPDVSMIAYAGGPRLDHVRAFQPGPLRRVRVEVRRRFPAHAPRQDWT